MNHTHRSIRSFLSSRIPSTRTVIGGSIVIAGIASAANVGSLITPLPTGVSTGDTIEAVHITNMAESITRLDNKTFQKDENEDRFNFPYLSTGNARPAGTEIHIWDDGRIEVSQVDTEIVKFKTYPDEASLPSPANEGSIAYVSGLGIYFHNGTEWIANGSSGTGGGNTAPDPIPANITLTAPNDIIIASVNDSNYLPITGPDGTADPTVDFQGSITTTGRTVLIPYTVTGSTSTLPAYNQSFTIDANDTEDGQGRTLTLSYPEQSLAVGSGTITATLKAEEGTLNAKKLDIDQHYQSANWLELASFTLPLDDQNTATITTKVAPGIPDANFGDGEHDFLYTPVTAADGTVWLNNTLGAEYNNINSPNFNPFQQATSESDHLAYGSLFQWGRPADGHELRACTDATSCTPKYGSTTTKSTTITPEHNTFITDNSSSAPYDWTTTDSDGTSRQAFWNKSDGTGICPVGFRVPSEAEITSTFVAENITNSASYLASVFKGTLSGRRIYNDASFNDISTYMFAWSQTFQSNNSRRFTLSETGPEWHTNSRSGGFSVRCKAE